MSDIDKCYPNDGKDWYVFTDNSNCIPEVIDIVCKATDNPYILFRNKDNGNEFTVRFNNNTDFFACRDGSVVLEAEILTVKNRKINKCYIIRMKE